MRRWLGVQPVDYDGILIALDQWLRYVQIVNGYAWDGISYGSLQDI